MSTCVRCGAAFSCAVEDKTDAPCWCMQLPPLPEPVLGQFSAGRPGAGCLCPDCLAELVRAAASPQTPRRS